MDLLFAINVGAFDRTWCEPPLWEYEPINKADLIQVQILTRHGARTPLHTSEQVDHIWKCNNTEFKLFYNPESHPMKVNVGFGQSIFKGECHFGQLIHEGSMALTRLGTHLRNIYVKKMKFLPSQYTEKIIQIRSTSSHRTIHSAINLANGLYPKHPPLAINVADKEMDTFRRGSLICPNLKLRIDAMKENTDFKKKYKQELEVVKNVSEKMKMKAKILSDIVIAARCNNISLPYEVPEKDLDDAAIVKFQQQFEIFSDPSIYPLAFSFSFGQILNTAIERAIGNSTLKFKHWSGHNGNIVGFLAYLGATLDKGPAYGSYIIMELWKTYQNEFVIRFNYNGKTIVPTRIANQTIVTLDEVIDFAHVNMPDLQYDCGFDPQKLMKSTIFRSEEI